MIQMYPDFARLFREAVESRSSGKPTQEEIGAVINLSQNHVSNISTGVRQPPLDKLVVLADFLELSGQKREEFLEAAYLAHTPPQIRTRQMRMEKTIATQALELADLRKVVDELRRRRKP